MATYTTNYNLSKPDSTDPFGNFRQSYNDNMDIIDANLGGGGGGSSVTWNQIQQSGAKIAEISINGTTTEVFAPTGTPSVLDVEVVDTIDSTKTASLAHAGRYLIVGQQGYNCTNVITLTGTYTTVLDESVEANQSGETSPRKVRVLIVDADSGVDVTFTITNSQWAATGGFVCELINTDTIGTPIVNYAKDSTTTVSVSGLTADTKFILLGTGAGRNTNNRWVTTTDINDKWEVKTTGNMVATIGDVVGGDSGSMSSYGYDGGMSSIFAIPYTLKSGGLYTAGDGIDIDGDNVISLEYLKVINGAVNLVFDDGT